MLGPRWLAGRQQGAVLGLLGPRRPAGRQQRDLWGDAWGTRPSMSVSLFYGCRWQRMLERPSVLTLGVAISGSCRNFASARSGYHSGFKLGAFVLPLASRMHPAAVLSISGSCIRTPEASRSDACRLAGHPVSIFIRVSRLARSANACCWKLQDLLGPSFVGSCYFRTVRFGALSITAFGPSLVPLRVVCAKGLFGTLWPCKKAGLEGGWG